jgi:hypothetical protein
LLSTPQMDHFFSTTFDDACAQKTERKTGFNTKEGSLLKLSLLTI